MTELYPTDTDLNALSGTSDADQEVAYPAIYESPYYTTFYKMLYRLLDVARRAGDLRVYKDGDLTFGVRAGTFMDGDTVRAFVGATGQSLTDNATNCIYLTPEAALVVSSSGFPAPSASPHIRLAEIVTAGGEYGLDDITDLRGTAFMAPAAGITASQMAEAVAFFAATDITAAEAETLTDGSIADSLHLHNAAGLSASLANRIGYLTVTASDDGDGTGSLTIQAKDAAGNDLAEHVLMEVWIGTADDFAPDAVTDFSVTTGTQREELAANAAYRVISDASGTVVMNIDNGGAGTLYAWASLGGRVASAGPINITSA